MADAKTNGGGEHAPVLLTVAEAAARLKVSKRSVRNMIDARTLRGVRYPGIRRVFIPEREVDRVIRKADAQAGGQADGVRLSQGPGPDAENGPEGSA